MFKRSHTVVLEVHLTFSTLWIAREKHTSTHINTHQQQTLDLTDSYCLDTSVNRTPFQDVITFYNLSCLPSRCLTTTAFQHLCSSQTCLTRLSPSSRRETMACDSNVHLTQNFNCPNIHRALCRRSPMKGKASAWVRSPRAKKCQCMG